MSLCAATLYLLRYSNGEIRLFSAGVDRQTTANATNMGFFQVCNSRLVYDLSDTPPANALSPIGGEHPLVLAISLFSINGQTALKAQSHIEHIISRLGLDYITNSAKEWTMRVMHELRLMGCFRYSENSLENVFSNANAQYIQSGEVGFADIGSPIFQ